jgi:hypothetical protein
MSTLEEQNTMFCTLTFTGSKTLYRALSRKCAQFPVCLFTCADAKKDDAVFSEYMSSFCNTEKSKILVSVERFQSV